jgi:hypothetical protein
MSKLSKIFRDSVKPLSDTNDLADNAEQVIDRFEKAILELQAQVATLTNHVRQLQEDRRAGL